MNLRPLDDRIIVEPITPEEKSKSGILLPASTKQEQYMISKIVKVNENLYNNKMLKVDDKIIISKYSGTEIEVEGKKYLIMKEKDVLAVIEE